MRAPFGKAADATNVSATRVEFVTRREYVIAGAPAANSATLSGATSAIALICFTRGTSPARVCIARAAIRQTRSIAVP